MTTGMRPRGKRGQIRLISTPGPLSTPLLAGLESGKRLNSASFAIFLTFDSNSTSEFDESDVLKPQNGPPLV